MIASISLECYFTDKRIFKALGDWSYSVYLVHVLVLSLGWYLSRRFELNPYAVVVGCVPVIMLASWISYRLLEQRLYQALKALSERCAPQPVSRQS
ncbi:hypothetical protein NVV93_09110 [Pseudomonas sp. LS44]|uniref:acyltransferase family protein n=1 Tax=Pseudomonas sp. LS44 TaxID=1357074 RepID=UPI00215A1171|nr:hypothetical protein [Pseudomonas sp. LS44]UVE19510.1 hypothetical protein NVV93_09110 [Pseudomonas sp. LS44]